MFNRHLDKFIERLLMMHMLAKTFEIWFFIKNLFQKTVQKIFET